MFKKDVTYHNPLLDAGVTETLYFNLTVPEVAELGLSLEDDMGSQIERMVETDDRHKMFAFFKLLMAHSYGRRTVDGKGFAKKKEWLDELFSGFAYEELFIWIFTDPANAALFFNQVMPKKSNVDRVNDAEQKAAANTPAKPNPQNMSREELERAFLDKMAGKTPTNEVTAD